MKKNLLIICILLICFIPLAILVGFEKFSVKEKLNFNGSNTTSAEKYKTIIWHLIVQELPSEFHTMNEKELQNNFGTTFSKENISIRIVDLNADKRNEILYIFSSSSNCGTAGCGVHQLIKDNNGKYIAKYLFHCPPAIIYILNTKTNGYNDLLFSTKHFTKSEGSDFKYRLFKYSLRKHNYIITN